MQSEGQRSQSAKGDVFQGLMWGAWSFAEPAVRIRDDAAAKQLHFHRGYSGQRSDSPNTGPRRLITCDKMQTQLRAPVSDARHLTVCRQGPGAPSQRLSLALPRTASRHASTLSRADEHALYAERLPGTTNFAAVSTSRLTVLCGSGLAHPNEVRRLFAHQRFAVPPSTCWAPSRGLLRLCALRIFLLCSHAAAQQLCGLGLGSRVFWLQPDAASRSLSSEHNSTLFSMNIRCSPRPLQSIAFAR